MTFIKFCQKHKHYEKKIQNELKKIACASRQRIILANVSNHQEFEMKNAKFDSDPSLIAKMPYARGLSTYSAKVEAQIFQNLEKFSDLTYFLTATVDPSRYCCSIDAWQQFSANWNRLRTYLSRVIQSFKYFAVLETTQRGWPHCHVLCNGNYLSTTELARLRSKWPARLEYKPIRNSYAFALGYVIKYLKKQHKNPRWMAFLRALKKRSYWTSRGLLPPLSSINKSDQTWEYVHTIPDDLLEELLNDGILIALKKSGSSRVPANEKYYIAEHREWVLFGSDGTYGKI